MNAVGFGHLGQIVIHGNSPCKLVNNSLKCGPPEACSGFVMFKVYAEVGPQLCLLGIISHIGGIEKWTKICKVEYRKGLTNRGNEV
ncbi:hypothetical protein EON65_44030 [archaeon]|nr:MAG: hypothetical protein EON65_44030 [archaeon]